MSTYRHNTTDQLIIWLGNVRFSMRGWNSAEMLRSLKAQESGMVAVLTGRGLSTASVAAIR